MDCSRHPGHSALEKCRKCGNRFCILCVVETDQAELCPDCFSKIRGEMEGEEKGASLPDVAPTLEEAGGESFLSLGPDEDFSFLREEEGVGTKRLLDRVGLPRKVGRIRDFRKKARKRGDQSSASPAKGQPIPLEAKETEDTAVGDYSRKVAIDPGEGKASEVSREAKPGDVDDRILEEVISAVLGTEQEAAEVEVPEETEEEKKRPERAKSLAGRFSFLAQPRVNEPTALTESWWKSTAFLIAVTLATALLWALPNAYLIPRDTEYGLHSLILGMAVGLVLWRKAGRKHGTRLAVQAFLVTFIGLSLGEAFHWFLTIVKNKALRTIVFDLITLRFLWENAGQVMRYVVEAMFPLSFLWILVLPSLTAFLIGFGMPPIPEIFFQMGRALRSGESQKM